MSAPASSNSLVAISTPACDALHVVTALSVLFWEAPSFGNWTLVVFRMDAPDPSAPSITFTSSEQAFMYWKAILFGDEASARRILATNDSRQQKKLGRGVKGFDQKVWDKEALPLMVRVLTAKFSQHPGWRALLLSTGDKQLIEASPTDKLWGVGMTAAQVIKAGEDPKAFKGDNLLGKALETVRAALRERKVRDNLTAEESARVLATIGYDLSRYEGADFQETVTGRYKELVEHNAKEGGLRGDDVENVRALYSRMTIPVPAEIAALLAQLE